MKAARIHKHGGVEVLEVENIPEPICDKNSVKVKIHATSINHLDIWIRNGIPGVKIKLPMILGSDGAGEVVEVGSNVSGWNVGTGVVIQPGTFCGKCNYCLGGKENYCLQYGIIGESENGTNCEYFNANPNNIYPKSNHLSWEESASMQLVCMTAYQMIVKRAKLTSTETILIYGATSGIGSAAIQIAKNIGAKVIATVGSEGKKHHAKELGADYTVIHTDDNWVEEVKSLTFENKIQVIFEHVGQDTWENSMKLLDKGGRIVTCGATTGSKVQFDLKHLFIKQQNIMGSTMSDISSFIEVQKLINNKKIKPFLDKIFPIENIIEAHKYIEQRNQKGKVVLTL